MTAVTIDEGVDAGLAWHFGNPVSEARALADGGGIARLDNREILELSGPERLSWLHNLTSQKLDDLVPQQPTTALILDPNGRVEHVLHGVDDGERFLAWTEPGRAAALVEFLERMKFMTRVEITRREDLRLAWFGHQVSVPDGWAARDSELGGSEVFIPVDADLPEAAPIGMWAFESARIAAGIPRMFVDTDHKTIPNEIGLFGTHLDKGCYRGQETVARVHTLGRPPRRLVMLHLDGTEEALPAIGSPLIYNDRESGFVGSSARHHELGPIAIALIKRNIPTDAEITVDGIAASQEVLVDPDVGLHIRPVLR